MNLYVYILAFDVIDNSSRCKQQVRLNSELSTSLFTYLIPHDAIALILSKKASKPTFLAVILKSRVAILLRVSTMFEKHPILFSCLDFDIHVLFDIAPIYLNCYTYRKQNEWYES